MMNKWLTTRNVMWFLALGLTLILVWFAPEKNDIVQAKRQSVTPQKIQQITHDAVVNDDAYHLNSRNADIDVHSNVFAVPSNDVPKPQPIKQQVMKPVAPLLPFNYLGSITLAQQEQLLMLLNDELLIVKVGDPIGSQYQLTDVKKMGDQSTLEFLYLPMKLKQTMVVNNAN